MGALCSLKPALLFAPLKNPGQSKLPTKPLLRAPFLALKCQGLEQCAQGHGFLHLQKPDIFVAFLLEVPQLNELQAP